MDKQKFKDRDLESIMGSLLRIGVIVSATIVLIGGCIYLVKHGGSYPHYNKFEGEPENLTKIQEIMKGVPELQGRAIVQLGLLVLIATPIARVLMSTVGFLFEKDYYYVFISLLVLGIIAYSLFSGKA